MARLSSLQESHTELSVEIYNSSITIVRDKDGLLPLSNILDPDEEVLLLSPLLKPLPASAASQGLASHGESPGSFPSDTLMSGENLFQEFGRSLAR